MRPFKTLPVAPGASSEPRRGFNIAREKLYTLIGLVALLAAATMVTLDFGRVFLERIGSGSAGLIIADAVFLLVVYYLIFGSLLYHVCRLGYLKRLASHCPASRADLERVYDSEHPRRLTVLVPSYREEERVVRQTLMSAAMMEYPNRRVVLLVDDPPHPPDTAAAAALAAMRELPQRIQALLRPQQRRYASELAMFEQRRVRGPLELADEARRVGGLYRDVAKWMEDQARGFEVRDHTDALFVGRILLEPARAHRARAAAIAARCQEASCALTEADLLREYKRLAALFAVRLTSFERKRFVNLSHAPNKAMNLNSYIGLIGKNFREVIRADGVYLEECEDYLAHLRVPPADYVITVDADSLLLNDYALRLLQVMEQPESQRFAVVQTPYTAVPGSPRPLERAAGAQTDQQWIMGQGSTLYGATFWIGASAVLRHRALEDICEVDYERGHPVKRYVRDRTLVEDTDSTVDLIANGWQLYNYPDRLSYSATPPDFGALVIQRRRWANGGLLVLPKLFRHLVRSRRHIGWLEMILRIQYLVSTAASNLAVLMLLLYPFQEMSSYWLPVAAAPYYALYGRDLLISNYRWRDLPRVYALNLLLIPVNLGGVAKSLHQWWTGRPSAFVRTPKVTSRTASPALYIVMSLAIPGCAALVATAGLLAGNLPQASFGFLSALAFLYAFARFIGVQQAWEDLTAGFATRWKLARRGSPARIDGAPTITREDVVEPIVESRPGKVISERTATAEAQLK